MTGIEVAAAVASEQAVLGAAMSSPRILSALGQLRPSDFWDPRNEDIFRLISEQARDGQPYDPVAVLSRLQTDPARLRRVGGGPYIHELYSSAVLADSVDYHVRAILDRAHLRELQGVAARFVQEAGRAESGGELQEWVESAVGKVARRSSDDLPTLMTMEEFLAEDLVESEFVVPGLFARGDRLIVTGLEGGGKSVLLRQIAACAAAGIDPFGRGDTYQPAKALIVDLENPKRIMRKTLGDLVGRVRGLSGVDPAQRMTLDRRPRGLSLDNPRDRSWLARSVEAVQPDVLVIGPLYKIYGHRDNDEANAARISEFLDEVRNISDSVLITEAHAGHASAGSRERNLRPIGSSLWLRWPEFGYGLAVDAKRSMPTKTVARWQNWRGDRDRRDWPEGIEWGAALPWVEAPPQ